MKNPNRDFHHEHLVLQILPFVISEENVCTQFCEDFDHVVEVEDFEHDVDVGADRDVEPRGDHVCQHHGHEVEQHHDAGQVLDVSCQLALLRFHEHR